MVVTVTLNPCYDRQTVIARLTHGGMNRVINTRTDAAGKGVNVSAALKNLGADSLCTGFNYRENGAALTRYLDGLKIAHDFVDVPGAVRTNIKLFERDTSVMTEINEPGGDVPGEYADELVEKAAALCADGPILVLSGSRPGNVPPGIYARIMESASGRVFLDTEGDALLAALNCARPPFLIKPNLFELETAFNVKLPDKLAVTDFCRREILPKGVAYVCVSMGGDGALLISAGGAWFAPALDIPVRGLAGAGDSMVAGMVYSLLRNAPPEEMLRMGAAAASASVVREGTLLCTGEGFGEMMGRVKVNPY